MIRQLSLLFKTYPEKYCELSPNGRLNLYRKIFLNFYYANKALLILTLGWICYELYMYDIIAARPRELFDPENYLGRILMATCPSKVLYFSIGILSFLLTLTLLIGKDNILIRSVLALQLLWLNLLQWSFGYMEATAHLFLLAHFFGIFMPFQLQTKSNIPKEVISAIHWYYSGLLLTYTFSGVWKCIGLAYKLLMKRGDVHWLHPDAALYNSVISFRNYDFPLRDVEKYFAFPLFWQISFVFILFIQTFCLFAVWRNPWQVWLGLFLLIFHLVNAVAFATVFILAPLVIFCLFFPYYLFSKKSDISELADVIFCGKGSNAVYQRNFNDGSRDRFLGFYAYREKIYDKRPIIGGLLYFPFLDTLMNLVWKFDEPVHGCRK